MIYLPPFESNYRRSAVNLDYFPRESAKSSLEKLV
jgi:hypothetical protein